MISKKSFIGLESAYAFFVNHTTQQRRAVEQGLAMLAGKLRADKRLRICFLGCGDVDLVLGLTASLEQTYALSVTLVDPHPGWLDEAASKVAKRLDTAPVVHRTLPDEAGIYDLVVAHHTLYYVADLQATVSRLRQVVAADGLLLTMLAAESNALRKCAVDLFALDGQALPYWSESDLVAALSAAAFRWEAQAVASTLDCPDTPQGRDALVHFLTGTRMDALSRSGATAAREVFDAHEQGERLRVPMQDTFLLCQPAMQKSMTA